MRDQTIKCKAASVRHTAADIDQMIVVQLMTTQTTREILPHREISLMATTDPLVTLANKGA
jgi:hypothetical protein